MSCESGTYIEHSQTQGAGVYIGCNTQTLHVRYIYTEHNQTQRAGVYIDCNTQTLRGRYIYIEHNQTQRAVVVTPRHYHRSGESDIYIFVYTHRTQSQRGLDSTQ